MQKEIASSAGTLEGWNYEKDVVGLFKNHSILHGFKKSFFKSGRKTIAPRPRYHDLYHIQYSILDHI